MEETTASRFGPGADWPRSASLFRRRRDLGSGCVRVRRNVERLGGHVGAARRRAAGRASSRTLRARQPLRRGTTVPGTTAAPVATRRRPTAPARRATLSERPRGPAPDAPGHVHSAPVSGQDLPGVHDPVRVEDSLDAPHQRQKIAVLGLEAVDLPEADPVLAGAGAAAGEGVLDEQLDQLVRPPHLVGVVRIDHQRRGARSRPRRGRRARRRARAARAPAARTRPPPRAPRAGRRRPSRAAASRGGAPPSRTRTRDVRPRGACAPSGRARRRCRALPRTRRSR